MSRAGVGPVCRCAGVAGACFILTGASKGVLDVLKSVYLGFRKVKVQRVTVVEFGMYNRSGDGVGCLEVKVGANAVQLSPMKRNSVFEELTVKRLELIRNAMRIQGSGVSLYAPSR